ncbi:hypothetical protein ACJ41O_003897 [Fusarium nematophilum]
MSSNPLQRCSTWPLASGRGPTTSNATYRIPEQRFGQSQRRDSWASDIAGGSAKQDPFRQAVSNRLQQGLSEAPAGSPFARQSNTYHASAAAAKTAEAAWKAAKPGPGRKALAPPVATAYAQEAKDRQNMRKNWSGYDSFQSAQGHAKRIQLVNSKVKTFQKKS